MWDSSHLSAIQSKLKSCLFDGAFNYSQFIHVCILTFALIIIYYNTPLGQGNFIYFPSPLAFTIHLISFFKSALGCTSNASSYI